MGNINSNLEGHVSIGPWGGTQGKPWKYKSDGWIKQIVVRHGSVIDSLVFQTQTSDGSLSFSEKYGGPGGGQTDKVNIDCPTEYLTAINMTIGDVITSLSFVTNVGKYGHFGTRSGTSLSIPVQDGVILGFHGYAGLYLNAIGIIVKATTPNFIPIEDKDSESIPHKATSVMKLDEPRDPGSWGGQGGKQWDDGVFTAVKQVHIRMGDSAIISFQLEYIKKDGESVWSQRHGGKGGQLVGVGLESNLEAILGIEGFYGPVPGENGFEAIRCMSIYTNKGKYGPYGQEIGKYFSSMQSGGKVVGFFGRSGSYLNAIGLHKDYS